MADKRVSLEVGVQIEGAESVEQLEQKLKEIEQKLKTSKGKGFEKLNKELKETKSKLDGVKDSANGTKKSMDKVGKSTKTMKKGVDGANKSMKNFAGGSKEAQGALSNIGNTMGGGMLGSFGSFVTSLKSVAMGFRGVGAAIAASGIGLLVLLIVGIVQAFKKSEEGQNKFAKIMGVIGSVIGNITDVLADLGMLLIDIFSGDGEAITKAKNFGKQLFDVVGLPIKTLIDIAKALGKSLGALFSGDFEGAANALAEGVDNIKGNFVEAKDAIVNATEAVKEFMEEATKDAELAAKIADKRARADKLDRSLIIKRAQANRDVAKLRADAEDKENFSVTQRIKFLEEAAEIQEKITKREIAAAQLRASALAAENSIDKSNKDALDAEANARAKVIELQTAQLTIQKALTAKKIALFAEEKAEQSKIEKDIRDRISVGLRDINKEDYDAKRKVAQANYDALEKELGAENNLTKIAKEQLNLELLEIANNQKIQEDKLEAERQKGILDIQNDYKTRAEDDKAVSEEEKLNLEKERVLAELDFLRATSEQKLEIEAYYAKQIADIKISEEEKVADAKREINRQVIDNVLNLAEGAFDKESKAGKNLFNVTKGIRVAQAIMDAYAAANAALAQTTDPTPTQSFRVGNAAVAITAGLLNVKKILSTKIGSSSGGGNGPNTAIQSGSVTRAQPRNINLTRTPNQKIDVNPIKVFVTESDISSAQINANNTKQVSVIR